MLLCGKNSVSDVGPLDVNQIQYHEPSEDDRWKLEMLDQLIDVQHGNLEIPGFTIGDILNIRDDICIN